LYLRNGAGMASPKVLVVDDEPDIRDTVRDILEEEGYAVILAADAAAAREARAREQPDVALLDIWMPGTDGISLLREWSEARALETCPVIMMSGHGTVETAVEATRLGAYDFIEKPISLAKLLLTIQRAREASRLRRENEGLRQHLALPLEPLGNSRAMTALRAQLDKLAQHDTWVLVQGEPGTGKEALARWLHEHGARRNGPFVAVAPASIPREHLVPALFGSESSDGTVQPGLIEQANGGTLFLDEVAELDSELQQRLASVLQRRALVRSGGRGPAELDLRVIAASAQPLDALVRAGRFREELYYLLNVVPITVPPLRERSEDVPELLRVYADFFANRDKLPYRHFPVAVQNRLRNYAWPGNVRELRNLVQRLLVLGSAPEVELAEVEAALGGGPGLAPVWVAGIDFDLPLRQAREQFERAYLLRQLQQVGGSVGKLAKAVGMERTHLYRKLRDLGVEVKSLGDKAEAESPQRPNESFRSSRLEP
jgi:DNA-binding NtrC family response regulator